MVARGTHPNSLANLRPFVAGSPTNPNGDRGPLITPAMRRYGRLSYTELAELAHSPEAEHLPTVDVIAITMLLKAAREVAWGDTAREQVIKRLDGEAPKLDIDVNVGVLVRYVEGGRAE